MKYLVMSLAVAGLVVAAQQSDAWAVNYENCGNRLAHMDRVCPPTNPTPSGEQTTCLNCAMAMQWCQADCGFDCSDEYGPYFPEIGETYDRTRHTCPKPWEKYRRGIITNLGSVASADIR